MALQFNGGPFAGSYTTNTFNAGRAQPMPPPSRGTPYGQQPSRITDMQYRGNIPIPKGAPQSVVDYMTKNPDKWTRGPSTRRPQAPQVAAGGGPRVDPIGWELAGQAHRLPWQPLGGNVFQGNLGRQPSPPSQSSGRVMDGPGSGFGPMRPTGYAQPIQEPSRGTPYGMPPPQMSDDSGYSRPSPRQPPQWDMGDDIRRPPSNPARPPMPPTPQPGRIMDGPGSGFGPSAGYGFGDDYRVLPGPGANPYSQPPQPQAQSRPAGNFANGQPGQKMQQSRPTYNVPGYANPVTDPIVAQNEYDRIAREQKAAARGEKPRKTQMELDMEDRNARHQQHVQQRTQIQEALPGQDQATLRAIQQRVSAYGETPEEALQNGGFAAQQAYANSRMNDGPGPSARTPAGQQFHGIYSPGADMSRMPYTDTMQANPGYQPPANLRPAPSPWQGRR